MAADATLFEWLTALYPVWAAMDAGMVGAAATAALGWLAKTGCTTTMDHHYVFPRGGGDVLRATIAAAADVGLRFHPSRGSMDLGASSGGLPPDEVVESRDEILAATQAAIEEFHDPAPESMLRIAVAPCSPFSVTGELMAEAAELARRAGVRLHTHLAETADEADYCAARFGCTPAEYVESLGWLGDDVWLAHGVHLDDSAIARLAATGTGVAHCPSSNGRLGAGVAPAGGLARGRRAGRPRCRRRRVAGGQLAGRRDAPGDAGGQGRGRPGARCRCARRWNWAPSAAPGCSAGRQRSDRVEPGKLADIALWRLDRLPHAGIADPVAALVLGSPAPLELLLVNGQAVVERDRLVTVDEEQAAAAASAVSAGLAARDGAAAPAGCRVGSAP